MIGFMQITAYHQPCIGVLIQWHGDDIELVRADESVSIATADPVFWELGDFECFSGKSWEGGFIKISNESQQSMQAISSKSLF
jgi:hypothetical protein